LVYFNGANRTDPTKASYRNLFGTEKDS